MRGNKCEICGFWNKQRRTRLIRWLLLFPRRLQHQFLMIFPAGSEERNVEKVLTSHSFEVCVDLVVVVHGPTPTRALSSLKEVAKHTVGIRILGNCSRDQRKDFYRFAQMGIPAAVLEPFQHCCSLDAAPDSRLCNRRHGQVKTNTERISPLDDSCRKNNSSESTELLRLIQPKVAAGLIETPSFLSKNTD